MAIGSIKQNLIPNEPELADVLAFHRKDIFLGLNCHHVGTVKSFDTTKQTATATINYRRTYFQPNSLGVVQPVLKSYPTLVDAPVISLGGGPFAQTFPISSGDECLVLFNDRDIDAWFAGSSDSPNPTSRLHSFADAFILVGLRSLPNVLVGYDSDGYAVRNKLGTVKLKLTDSGQFQFKNAVGEVDFYNTGKFKVQNATADLVTVLYSLLNAITTATAGGFNLILPPTYATDLAKLLTFQP